MSGPTPRRLLHFVTRRLRLRPYLRNPADGRPQPQIPAPLLLWALLVGQILRQFSFHALEATALGNRARLLLSAGRSTPRNPDAEARLKDNLPELCTAAQKRFPSGPPSTVFRHGWQTLRPALTNTVDGLFVADFTGSGKADVVMSCDSLFSPGCWRVSYGGVQDWHYFTLGSFVSIVAAGVGHFLGRAEADLLSWNGTQRRISAGGTNPLTRYSSQDMR